MGRLFLYAGEIRLHEPCHIGGKGGIEGQPLPGEGLGQLQVGGMEGGPGNEVNILGAVKEIPGQRVA